MPFILSIPQNLLVQTTELLRVKKIKYPLYEIVEISPAVGRVIKGQTESRLQSLLSKHKQFTAGYL